MKQGYILCAFLWAFAHTSYPRSDATAHQLSDLQHISRTAQNIADMVAQRYNHETPAIYWNTDDIYPYPDEAGYNIVLPKTAFTYHLFPHEVTRCTAAVLQYTYGDVFDSKQHTRYVYSHVYTTLILLRNIAYRNTRGMHAINTQYSTIHIPNSPMWDYNTGKLCTTRAPHISYLNTRTKSNEIHSLVNTNTENCGTSTNILIGIIIYNGRVYDSAIV